MTDDERNEALAALAMLDVLHPSARPTLKSGPGGVSAWSDDTVAWCQRCDRPIRHGQPYMPRIPMVGSHAGFDHAWCPPALRLIRGGAT